MDVSGSAGVDRIRTAGRMVAVSLAVTALFALAVPGVADAVAGLPGRGPATTTTTKYYVVAPPVDGQREYLFAIAVRTLGNGKRYHEIFDLNRDRQQPDGGRLTDPMDELHPGWILLLPADAKGPDVHTGAVPAVAPPAAASTGPPHTTQANGNAGLAGRLAFAGGMALTTLVLGGALLLRRRRRRAVPVALDGERPHLPEHPALPELHARLAGEQDQLSVRLIAVVPGREEPAYAWLAPGEEAPPARMPVVLGRTGRWRLHVDLAATPDVVTVTGPAANRRRVASALARQLTQAGVRVLAVGDVLGTEVPQRCERLAGFPSVPDGTGDGAEPAAVICEELAGHRAALARAAVAANAGWVTIVVGDVARARWSVEVGDPDACQTR